MRGERRDAFCELRVLGPIEVLDAEGCVVLVSSRRERTLLAALAARTGRATSTDALIEMVWGEDAPRSAAHALQVHVSKLRKLLGGSPSPLVTRTPGYLLQLAPGQLDADRFEDLAARGRAALATGDVRRASLLLHEALSLWRGPAFGDVEWERFAEPDVRRLEELRLAAEEDRIEAAMCNGLGPAVLAEAEEMVVAEPLRERRWAQLMLCLYRSKRQAEALRRFQDVRRLMIDELGVEPSRQLRDLEERILRQDPTLDAEASSASPIGTRPPTRFALIGQTHLAYQVIGTGPPDLVLIPGITGHLEVRWEEPSLSALYRRLSTSARLVLFDKRGTGMSDREGGMPRVEDQVDDVLAIMDAVGSERAVLVGVLDGAAIALLTATAHPRRVAAVITYAGFPVFAAADYPHGSSAALEVMRAVAARDLDIDEAARAWAPSRLDDPEFIGWMERYLRMGAGVGGSAAIVDRIAEIDIRAILPDVRVPVLALHRRGDNVVSAGNATWLADHLPMGRAVLLPGRDSLLWAGDVDAPAAEIERYLRSIDNEGRASRPA
jgi:DNA-binding SARP family transcriptional activator/pimeloyl-ACP methyl ester carboxylesterase